MAGLTRQDENRREGKYPIVLRRDGTVVVDDYFVMMLKDPCTAAALKAYVDEAERRGMEKLKERFGLPGGFDTTEKTLDEAGTKTIIEVRAVREE